MPLIIKNMNLRDSTIYFKLEIENRIFKVREKDGYIFLDDTKAYKKSKKPLYSINDTSRTKIKTVTR